MFPLVCNQPGEDGFLVVHNKQLAAVFCRQIQNVGKGVSLPSELYSDIPFFFFILSTFPQDESWLLSAGDTQTMVCHTVQQRRGHFRGVFVQ